MSTISNIMENAAKTLGMATPASVKQGGRRRRGSKKMQKKNTKKLQTLL